MNCSTAEECWKIIQRDRNPKLLATIEKFVHDSNQPAKVVFGTSGWRGETGSEFTFRNLRIVTRAVIDTLKSTDPVLRKALGTPDFKSVRERGVLIGHDNRFLGPEFSNEVIRMLAAEGIRVFFGGETTTPQISASIEMLGAACSINITPSHNPSNYSGFKFNPADGGPAGSEITDQIQAEANRLMNNPDEVPETAGLLEYEQADTNELYLNFIRRRGTIDLQGIRQFLKNSDCLVAVDFVHGATRGRPEFLFDAPPGKLVTLRSNDDYLFGGVAPEPSEKNMEGVEKILRESKAAFRIGGIMDPDGDRIRFADHTMQIPMNYFGAMAFHFLHVIKGFRGVAVKSVGTSNFVNAIADRHGIPVIETKVGFKNFRPYLLPDAAEKAVVAFEESDGISGYNHTLEKDALFGLMLAIEMVSATGKNLGDYLKDLMDEYGHFYPDRSGIAVDRSLAGERLKRKIAGIGERFPEGSSLRIDGKDLKVKDLITVDGTKIVLEDGSWLMIRPSGTEPKVRFYIEARSEEERESIMKTARDLTEAAIQG